MTPALLPADTKGKHPGAEPLPGYRLLERLGRGGFGEVWKCEAPGGLHKAVKFVPTGGDGFRQETAAFEQIKAIRHPFLLTLERVEKTADELVMVMELADGQLHTRLTECKADGLSGIPADELLGYLREVAEALDTMGAKYGLQHLDVKPENLFLVAGHAKVGDYGLVRRAELGNTTGESDGGFTPKYTAPEVLLGGVDIRSDQYSLGLVYVELLTGVFPYPGRTLQQLMLQHMRGAPDLGGLPDAERPVVSRALSKDPADRFPSCLAFVKALAAARPPAPPPPRRTPGASDIVLPDLPPYAAGYAITPPPLDGGFYPTGRPAGETEQSRRQLTAGIRRTATQREAEREPHRDPFEDLLTVMEVGRLHRPRPRRDGQPEYGPREFAEAVVRATALADGVETIDLETADDLSGRFLTTIPAPMVPYKLVIVAERWGLSCRQPDPSTVVLRRVMRVEVPKGTTPPPPAGFDVVVRLPAPPAAEISLSADLFGRPDDPFVRTANADIPLILGQIRGQLQNLEERRAHPRYTTDMSVRVHPLFPDGDVGTGISGRCVDVSLGGVRFVTPVAVRAERLFVEFPEVDEASGLAIYVRVLRSWPHAAGQGVCTVGRFRLTQG